MNISFLLQDERLMEGFLAEKRMEDDILQFYNDPDEVILAWKEQSRNGHAFVISDRLFDLATLAEMVGELKESAVKINIVLLLSNHHDVMKNEQYIKYCLSNQLLYVHPGQTVASIVKKVYSHIYGEHVYERAKRNKLVLFIGSTPNIGTTLVSFGTAVQLAQQTDHTIGYLCLNLKSSKIHRYLGMDQPAVTLDEIRAELRAQDISKERLQQYCEKVKEAPNLYILFGNMLREQAEFYTPEDIEYLLQLASSTFDLCIVEVNAYWDNAATICGLLHADTKVVVSTRELTHFQEDIDRWIKTVSNVFEMETASFDLFITQQEGLGGTSGFSMKEIRKETTMQIIGEMRRHPYVNEYLNQGRIMGLFRAPSPLMADLSGFVNTLIALYDLRRKQPRIEKHWIHRLLTGANAT